MPEPAARAPVGARATKRTGWTRENRIRANHAMLDDLRALWDEYPDMRFGQLVMNVSRTEGGFADTWEWGHGEWRERISEAYDAWKGAARVAPSSAAASRHRLHARFGCPTCWFYGLLAAWRTR